MRRMANLHPTCELDSSLSSYIELRLFEGLTGVLEKLIKGFLNQLPRALLPIELLRLCAGKIRVLGVKKSVDLSDLHFQPIKQQ